MGFISDNTKSKWGRRKQYDLVGGIVMGVAYIFMWQLFRSIHYNLIFGISLYGPLFFI
ncbi:MAG: hypothetical protein CM15mP83_2730 [Flavobacteriaceae bacterium]|nr:MAG: hypothetical protein CM15mP83_2730 [Flavobacteriaceae bacterium]